MEIISSSRLDLIPLSPEFLQACLEGSRQQAEQIAGFSIPDDWLLERDLIQIRWKQLRKDPDLQPWLLRAIVFRDSDQMVGHIGFHTRPGADYLKTYASEGIEFGYTVFPAFRRRGFAREASRALMNWAHRKHAVTQFIVSISPDNTASQALANSLGFRKVGEWVDEEDGLEEVFLLDIREKTPESE